jgi:hypothetical protein
MDSRRGGDVRKQILTVCIGITVFVLLTIWFSLNAFHMYGNERFGPNFASAMVGGSLGAAISLIVVLISFVLQQQSRSSALEPARYLFLRQEGERLKESYVRYLDVLRLGQQTSVMLAGKSWEALKREFWPDIDTIAEVESYINKLPVSGLYNNQAVTGAYDQLRASIEQVVRMSATAVFEGKENLIVPVLWEADFKVGSLWARLQELGAGKAAQQSLDLTPVEKPIKEAGISVGELLKALCKLGKDIKLE